MKQHTKQVKKQEIEIRTMKEFEEKYFPGSVEESRSETVNIEVLTALLATEVLDKIKLRLSK